MRVLCAATSSMQKETEPTGFLWAPSQLTGSRLTPSGRTGSSAGGSVVRLLQCDCWLWDRRLWCSAQVWSSWRRPSRSAREERRGGSRHGSPNCPLFHPEAWMEDAACLSSGTGRDDVSISTFIYLLIIFFFYSHDLEGCGCRWFSRRGEGDADECMTSPNRVAMAIRDAWYVLQKNSPWVNRTSLLLLPSEFICRITLLTFYSDNYWTAQLWENTWTWGAKVKNQPPRRPPPVHFGIFPNVPGYSGALVPFRCKCGPGIADKYLIIYI